MATWEEIRDEVAGMLADGEPLEDVITKLEKHKNEMAKENLLKAMDEMKKREQTKAELDKKWENTVWDTDVYLDDIDGKVPMTNEEWLKQCNTEQLAEFINDAIGKCYNCGRGYTAHPAYCPFHRCLLGSVYGITEWLIQPHREE